MLRHVLSFVRYHPTLGPWWGKLQTRDDFAWSTYTTASYQPNLERASQIETRQLAKVAWAIDDGRIVLHDAPDLEPTHRLLYETILRLHPASVMEFGCGGGDHLANLHLLLPSASLRGFDIGASQLALARERNGLDGIPLEVRDLTQPLAWADRADLVFCNAVMMHLGGGRHRRFLANMLAASSRYVLFAENWRRHDFAADVRAQQQIPQLLERPHGVRAILIDQRLREATDATLRA